MLNQVTFGMNVTKLQKLVKDNGLKIIAAPLNHDPSKCGAKIVDPQREIWLQHTFAQENGRSSIAVNVDGFGDSRMKAIANLAKKLPTHGKIELHYDSNKQGIMGETIKEINYFA